MLDRYVIPERAELEREFAPVRPWWRFAPSFNVAPGRYVPVIRVHEGEVEGVMMRWGLIPAAAEGEPPAYPTHTVVSDTILRAEDYCPPWLSGQRCIVPLAGYYLWQRASRGHQQPHYLRISGQPVFGIAAIWDRSVSEEDDVTESCALVMLPVASVETEAREPGAFRPAVLPRESREKWLYANPAEAMHLLGRLPLPSVISHPVGPWINASARDDASLIAAVEPEAFDLGASFRPSGQETE